MGPIMTSNDIWLPSGIVVEGCLSLHFEIDNRKADDHEQMA
jgi:hypothetical protein